MNQQLLLLPLLMSLCVVTAGSLSNRMVYAQSGDLPESAGIVSDVDLLRLEQRVKTLVPNVFDKVVSLEGGSGVIATSDGWVLTAAHVSGKPGRRIKVRLANGVLWPAETYGVNWQTDIGLVRLLGDRKWPHLKSAKNLVLKPGEWCMALGYPWDDTSATSPAARVGRVSSLNAERIVSDIPIIGGDSGGPVLNLAGQVVGINSRIRMDVRHNIHVSIQQFAKDWKRLVAGDQINRDASSFSAGNDDVVGRHGRDAILVRSENALPLSAMQKSVVKIYSRPLGGKSEKNSEKGGAIVLGTIMSRSGLVVSKFSELPTRDAGGQSELQFECVVDGKKVLASLLVSDSKVDLALLQLKSEKEVDFVPAKFADKNDTKNEIRSGQICISMVDRESSSWSGALGMVMVPAQDFSVIAKRQEVDTGIVFGPDSGMLVKSVFRESLAQTAGVRIGDRIEKVGSRKVKTEMEFLRELERVRPGETTQLAVVRAGRSLELSCEMPDRKPVIWDRWGGGPFSHRRFGFGAVIAHDGVVSPADCGGPLVDVQGNVLGVNISRAMRNTTYAIPIKTVVEFVRKCQPDAELGRAQEN